jgi:predicted DNA binding CopG/RHH family protein
MKKEKKDRKLDIRLSQRDMEKLEQLAKKYNINKSELIRKLIHETG